MSRTKRVPKYRHYQPKNLGVVRIQGRDFYLGEYESPQSWEKYHGLIAEHLATNGRHLLGSQSELFRLRSLNSQSTKFSCATGSLPSRITKETATRPKN